MPPLSPAHIAQLLQDADNAGSNAAKGRILEDLASYLFAQVPGITIVQRNQVNVFNSEEIDVAFWNTQHPDGFYFLPHIVLVECKNWSTPLASNEVGWFDLKLMHRAQQLGILIASKGITGDPADLDASHHIVSAALQAGRQIVVISREEITKLTTTTDLVTLIQLKLCQLAVAGTSLLPTAAA